MPGDFLAHSANMWPVQYHLCWIAKSLDAAKAADIECNFPLRMFFFDILVYDSPSQIGGKNRFLGTTCKRIRDKEVLSRL